MKHLPTLLIFTALLFAISSCNRKSTEPERTVVLDKNCELNPEPGPCRMAIKRYYYDPKEKKCKEFIYGGCQGVVPFETLEECRKKCGCEEE
jgi:hypothetical protein